MCLSIRLFARVVVCFACWLIVGVALDVLHAMFLDACIMRSLVRWLRSDSIIFLSFDRFVVRWIKRLFARLVFALWDDSFARSFLLRLFVLPLVLRFFVFVCFPCLLLFFVGWFLFCSYGTRL